jgi:hypothetical protein
MKLHVRGVASAIMHATIPYCTTPSNCRHTNYDGSFKVLSLDGRVLDADELMRSNRLRTIPDASLAAY